MSRPPTNPPDDASPDTIFSPLTTAATNWLTPTWPPHFFIPGCFCCGGQAVAYFCGGTNATSNVFYGTADRTQFATDLTSASPSSNLTVNRAEPASAANPAVASYICGGRTSAGNSVVTADKLSFPTATTSASPPSNLSSARYSFAAISDLSQAAYFAGGFSGAPTKIGDKLIFATDATAAATSADLSISRGGLAGVSNGATKGYFAGGFTGGPGWTKRTDRLLFSTDSTTAQTTADLSVGRDRYHGVSNGTTKGYFAGGQTGVGISVTDQITFASDTTATQTSAALLRHGGGAMSNGTIAYAGGGITPSGVSGSLHKLTFATDSAIVLGVGSGLSTARVGISGHSTIGL